jgi:hypothetical protein
VTAGDVVRVEVQASLLIESEEQIDELVRELELMELGARSGESVVPPRLGVLVSEVLDRVDEVRESARRQAAEVLDAEGRDATVELELPGPTAVTALVHLYELLGEIDEHCARGELLTLAAPDHVGQFRRDMVERLQPLA